MPRFRLQDDDFKDHVSSTRFCLDQEDEFPQELVPRMQWTKQAKFRDPAVDRLTKLLAAATLVDEAAQTPPPALLQNAHTASRSVPNQERAADEMKVLREKMRSENRAFEANLKLLIETTERKAEAVRQEAIRKQEEERKREAEQNALKEAQKKKEEDAMAAKEKAASKASESGGATEARREEKSGEVAASQPSSDIQEGDAHEAKKLVKMLATFQANAKAFEVSQDQTDKKRRLQFKKLANGKLNTLSENVEKIQSVAADVVATIRQAENDDKVNNANGRDYLLDLISVNVMTRAQADGFNGLRGDGFPLAAMLAMIGNEYPSFNNIFMAHVYATCPVSIPEFPNSSNSSDESFMESLGMKRTSNGEFESFDKFVSRTEGIISLMGGIIACHPSSHNLIGGNKGGIRWLEKFIEILPASTPLPVLTAPVLDSFLTATGHMLACHHSNAFRTLLQQVNDLISRLDDSSIGAPSATRLKKTIEGGFETFRKALPNRALPGLYYGMSEAASQPTKHSAPSMTQSSPFGARSSPFGALPASKTSPFGNSNANEQPAGQLCKYFAQGNCRYGDKCKFSHGDTGKSQPSSQPGNTSQFGPNTSSSPFGATQAPSPSPFGAAQLSSPFGTAPSPSPFGAAPSPSPFGTAPSPSPFGGKPSQSPFEKTQASQVGASVFSTSSNTSTFGSTQTSNNAQVGSNPSPFSSSQTPTVPSPFGSAQNSGAGVLHGPSPSPFSAPSNSSTTGQSPFGPGNPSPSPFGGAAFGPPTPAFGINPSQSPFGASTNSTPFSNAQATTPFAHGAGTSGNSIFGSGVATGTSPFSGASNTPAFGASVAPSPTPFSSGPSPFGVSAPKAPAFGGSSSNTAFGLSPSPSPFGVSAPSATPFGGSTTTTNFGTAPSPFPFGVASNPSPFGAPAPSPFGAVQTPSTFGGAGPSPSPFGTMAPTPSPFGGMAPSPSPFGGMKTSPSPFGVANPSPSPFGNAAPNPSPFGAPSPSPFGAANASPFGTNQAPSPFGGPAPSPSPFGAPAPNASPFGGFGSASPSPTPFSTSTFGGGQNIGPFGGGSMQSGSRQNANSKPPCKYYAQGRCNFGNNCRFSHEIPQNNGFNTPFGGPRR